MVIGLVLTLYPFQSTKPVKAHPCLSNKPVLGHRDDLMRVPPLQRQFSLPPRDDGRAFLAACGAAVLSEVVVHAILEMRRLHSSFVGKLIQEAETFCEDPAASEDAVSFPLSATFFSSSL